MEIVNEKVEKLGVILMSINELPWSHSVYLSGEGPWVELTPCLVLDPDDSDAVDEVPQAAKHLKFNKSISISTIQDIVENAKIQNPQSDVQDLIKAFNFYYDHDAYIILAH